jgi:calmodulin
MVKRSFGIVKSDILGDGHITAEELKQAMKKLGRSVSDAEVKDMINAVDVDRSGTVEFPEFCQLMGEETGLSPDQELLLAFKTFDKANLKIQYSYRNRMEMVT